MVLRRVLAIVLLCVFLAPQALFAQTAEDRAKLQAELDSIERDITQNKGVLSDLQARRTSLERDISILDNKIKTAQLQIKQTDLTLKQLQGNISAKVSAMEGVNTRVQKSEESLAQILRLTREIDDKSFAEAALGGSFSDLFQEFDDFGSIQGAMHTSFVQLAALKSDLSSRKQALEEQEDETEKVRGAQVIAKNAVQKDQQARKTILTVTKGQEKTYQQIIADKQKQADAIRAALFGLRDSSAIPFGTAYQYAKEASVSTGVRPALVLAILTQESDLGVNVGSCYVTNLQNGSGKKKSGTYVANVMKAPRDTVPFQTITEAIGRDWSNTPVSCPQSVGYGGAMGPSQFIASTWMLFKNRLASATGESFPNPWNPRTAIFATALYMSDLGADSQTAAAEKTAACKYFSGRACSGAIATYGSSVLEHAADIQSQIDIIGG